MTVYVQFYKRIFKGTDTCNNHKVSEKQVPVREETINYNGMY